jgi:hypothetical protein
MVEEHSVSQPLPPYREQRFLGQHDDTKQVLPEGFVYRAENVLLENGRLRSRGGFNALGSQLAANDVQGILSWEERDGTQHLTAICNAEQYEWNGASWVAQSLAGKPISVDPSAQVDMIEFNGKLIVTDGVNQPWQWDGQSTWTQPLNAESVICRQLANYYVKLFLLDQLTISNRIAWSYEGDVTHAQSFDPTNQWDYGQTDQGRIYGGIGHNERLLLFKQDSVSAIRGPVDATFETDAVREGVDTSIGAITGHAICVGDNEATYFLSQIGPMRIGQGSMALTDIAMGSNGEEFLKELWARVNRQYWDNSWAVYYRPDNLIIFAVPLDSDTLPKHALVYQIDEHAWCLWDLPPGGSTTCGTVYEDANGDEWLVVGTDAGYVFRYQPAVLHDSGTSGIPRRVLTRDYGRDSDLLQKVFSRIDLSLEVDGRTTFRVTPAYEDNVYPTKGAVLEGAGRFKYSRGLNVFAPFCRFEISADQPDEDFVLAGLSVYSAAVSGEAQNE